jgi:PAS domain S-box-containing protein
MPIPRPGSGSSGWWSVQTLVASGPGRSSAPDLAATYERAFTTLLRHYFHAAPEGLVVHADGVIIEVNAPFTELFGYESAELVGTSIFELVAPEERTEVASQYSRLDGPVTYQCVRRDGSRVLIESRAGWIQYGGERARLATAVDVTTLRRGEAKLREANERFRVAFDNAPIGMALVGTDGRYLYVNDAVCQITGYSAHELTHLRPEDIGHPDDLQTQTDQVLRMLAGEFPRFSMEKRYFHADGHVVWANLHMSLVRGLDGTPRHFISQIEDVTDPKHMEGALSREAATVRLLRRVAVAANEATHPDDAFATAIGAICAYTGCPIGHVYERPHDSDRLVATSIWHFDEPERFVEFRRVTDESELLPGQGLPGTVLELGHTTWVDEMVGERGVIARELGIRSGFAFPVLIGQEVVAVLEFFSTDAMEPPLDLLGVMADVGTQLGRVVERSRIGDQHVELGAARSRFVANAAHELRTPLATLRTVAGLLGTRRDDMTADEVEQCCEILERQGRHLEALVADLLDLTTIEHGSVAHSDATSSLDELLANAIAIAPPPRHVTFATSLEPGLLVQGDADRLVRVLVNLLTNAYRHGGPDVRVGASTDDDRVVIAIEDDGEGVAGQVAAQLFEPFTRAMSRRNGGNGLGLAIAHGIVEQHGGSIAYEPRTPRGARFVVRLPVAS